MEQPKTPFNLNFNLVVLPLVILLVIASFVIGSLYTKVNYLEKGGTLAVEQKVNQPTNAPSPAGQPQPQAAIKKPEVTNADYYRGNKNAKVTLVEYSDFECPFCKRFHPTMLQAMKEYGDKIKWVYRHFPLSFHANAQKAAEASECVGKLAGNDAFWKFADLYFERTTGNGTGFALDKLADLGAEAGANKAAVQKCLDSNEMAQKVKDQMAKGSDEGVTGTPGTIIIDAKGGTQLVPGALPFEQLKPMIDQALE
jgi:protein-disulfide isomerase